MTNSLPKTTSTTKRLYSIGEAAEFLGVSIDTLRRWDAKGKIKTVRIGMNRYFAEKDLNKLLKGKEPKPVKVATAPSIQPVSATVVQPAAQAVQTVQTVPQVHTQLPQHPRPLQVEKPIPDVVPSPPQVTVPVLYDALHLDQKKFLKISTRVTAFALSFLLTIGFSSRTLAHFFGPVRLVPQEQSGSVLADQTQLQDLLFQINVPSIFFEDVQFQKNIWAQQDASVSGDLITEGEVAINGGSLTSNSSVFNLLTDGVTTLNIGGAASTVEIGATTGTTTINNALEVADGATVGTDLTVGGNLEVGDITAINDIPYTFPTTQGSSGTFLRNNGAGTLTWGTITIPDVPDNFSDLSGTVSISQGGTNSTATPMAGGIAYGTGSAYAFTSAGVTSQCLRSNGTSAPTWVDCSTLFSGNWTIANGAIYPDNATVDLLIGGTASTSAKFAFTNVNSGTPTLTINGSSGDLVLTADGTIQTTGGQALTLGGATSDLITFTGRVTNGTSLIPAVNLGSDLGSSSLRFNNLYVGTINSNSTLSQTGQALFTYEPPDTSYTESSVLINPTAPLSNSFLLGIGAGGNQRAGIDAEGDLTLGYNGGVSAPNNSNPLSIYGHNTTEVASIDPSGNLTLSGNIDTTLTAGSVVFAGTNGVLSQDNSNFFWDDTNNRLGLGTVSPQGKLNILNAVEAEVLFSGAGTSNIYQSHSTGVLFINTNTGNLILGANGSGSSHLVIESTGEVGIGDSSPDALLELLGTTEQLRLTHTDDTTDARFTISSTGDLTLDLLGSGTAEQLVLGDTDTLNIGGSGSNDVAYNVIGDSTSGATSVVNSDDDLYVEGNVQVDGVIAGDATDSLRLQAGGTTAGSSGNSSIYFLDSTGVSRGRFDTAATVNEFGDGADGDVTVSSSKNINTDIIASGRVTYADGIAYRINAPGAGATSVTRFSGSDTLSNGLTAGDEVLLINLQGTSSDNADVGNYEFLTISSVTASTVTFTSSIDNSYSGTSAANQKVVIQRVPNYGNVTVSSGGTITASQYESLATAPTGGAGYLTGVVAFRANGTVTISSGGTISNSGKGFSNNAGSSGQQIGLQGNGHAGDSSTRSCTANGNAGGGGGLGDAGHDAGGGGGGGNAAAGSNSSGAAVTPNCNGVGGAAVGDTSLVDMFLGGSGGSGGSNAGGTGGAGGDGGGIVFVRATTLSVAGSIVSNGTNGGNGSGEGGGGGGGAGGTVNLGASSVTLGSSLVTATNGTGGTGTSGGANGGAGSTGRIRVLYQSSLSGTTSPSAVSDITTFATNSYGTLYVGEVNTISADLAEYYVTDDLSIQAGDVVKVVKRDVVNQDGEKIGTKGVLQKADAPYSSQLLGIISTDPGLVLGSIDGATGNKDSRIVALSGRIPVKIASSSQPIKVGDYLTSSTEQGKAMKATRHGYTIAKALEDWEPGSTDNSIMAFANLGYYDPDVGATVDDLDQYSMPVTEVVAHGTGLDALQTSPFGRFILSSPIGETVQRVLTASDALVANLKAGNVTATSIQTDSLTIQNMSLADYVAMVMKNVKDEEARAATASGTVAEVSTENTPSATESASTASAELATTPLDLNLEGTVLGEQAQVIVSKPGAGSVRTNLEDLNMAASDISLNASTLQLSKYLEVGGNAFIGGDLGVNQSLILGQGLQLTDTGFDYMDVVPNEGRQLSLLGSGKGMLSVLNGILKIDDTGKVAVRGDLDVFGRITHHDRDAGGFVVIDAGYAETTVTFDKAFTRKPVVQVTAEDYDGSYSLRQVSTTGFTIRLRETATTPVVVHWTALAVDGAPSGTSGGTPASTPAPDQSPAPESQLQGSVAGESTEFAESIPTIEPTPSASPSSSPIPSSEPSPTPAGEATSSPLPTTEPVASGSGSVSE